MKLTITLLIAILSIVGFSQTAEPKTETTVKSDLSVSNIQVIEDTVIFDAIVVKDGTKHTLVIVANCLTHMSLIVSMTNNDMVYRMNMKPSIPEKDTPFEKSVLMACKNIKLN